MVNFHQVNAIKKKKKIEEKTIVDWKDFLFKIDKMMMIISNRKNYRESCEKNRIVINRNEHNDDENGNQMK